MRLKLALAVVGFAWGSHAATITAVPSQRSALVGNTVHVDVSVSDVANLYAFQFDLSYSASILAPQNVTEAGYFSSNGVSFSSGTVNDSTGRITLVADSLSGNSPGFTGTTLLASITFTAQSGGTAQITPVNVVLLNNSLSDISASTVGSSVSVTSAAIAPEPSSSVLLCFGLGSLYLGLRQVRLSSKRLVLQEAHSG